MGELVGIRGLCGDASSEGGGGAPSGAAGVYSGSAEVDFGSTGGGFVSVAVTGLEWVQSTSRVTVSIVPHADDHDPEDALLEQLVASAAADATAGQIIRGVFTPLTTWD